MVDLPLELVSLILDHNADDNTSLCVSRLVSKSWYQLVEPLLWSTMQLRTIEDCIIWDRRVEDDLRFVRFISTVEISGSAILLPDSLNGSDPLQALLCHLLKINHLRFLGSAIDSDHILDLLDPSIVPLSDITALSLITTEDSSSRGVRVKAQELLDLINRMLALEYLSFYEVEVRPTNRTPRSDNNIAAVRNQSAHEIALFRDPPQPRPQPKSLKRVNLAGGVLTLIPLLACMLSPVFDLTAVDTVVLGWDYREHTQAVASPPETDEPCSELLDFLRAVSPSVKDLSLKYASSQPAYDGNLWLREFLVLSFHVFMRISRSPGSLKEANVHLRFPSLRSLFLYSKYCSDSDPIVILSILPHIHAPICEELSIAIPLRPDGVVSVRGNTKHEDLLEWKMLETSILGGETSTSNFPSLKRVVFFYDVVGSASEKAREDVEQIMRRNLPLLCGERPTSHPRVEFRYVLGVLLCRYRLWLNLF
jgi:hypothetical protein